VGDSELSNHFESQHLTKCDTPMYEGLEHIEAMEARHVDGIPDPDDPTFVSEEVTWRIWMNKNAAHRDESCHEAQFSDGGPR
jgi:hypothetical protein